MTDNRAVEIGRYIVDKSCTIRQAASKFGVCKSTVACDMERLKNISLSLYNDVRGVMENNKSECTLRGGMATKRRWLEIRNKREDVSDVGQA